MEKSFTLQVALPVKEEKSVGEGFSFKQVAPFKCLAYDYKGDVSQMAPAYEMLFQHIGDHQIQPNDEIREVYKQWVDLSSSDNITEIQLSLKQPARSACPYGRRS